MKKLIQSLLFVTSLLISSQVMADSSTETSYTDITVTVTVVPACAYNNAPADKTTLAVMIGITGVAFLACGLLAPTQSLQNPDGLPSGMNSLCNISGAICIGTGTALIVF